MPQILVVDDDAPIAELLNDQLKLAGHQVTIARDGDEALRASRELEPDLIVLDVMLPKRSGIEVCAAIRASERPQPLIVMLTAKRSDIDAVVGYEVGADDYMRKPFSVRELIARIDALLRLEDRLGRDRRDAHRVSDRGFELDWKKREVRVQGIPLKFTQKEFDLLAHFARHPGEVFTREQLLADVWGYNHAGSARTVDSHVTRVRKKLEEAGLGVDPIKTIHGVGYRFDRLEQA